MKNLLLFVSVACASGVFAQTCPGLDFESFPAGTLSSSLSLPGFTVTHGSHTVSAASHNCDPTVCCTYDPQNAAVLDVSNGLVDPNIGVTYTIYSVFGSAPGHTNAATVNPQLNVPFGGSKVFRLNYNGSYTIERLERTFSVTPSNNHLRVAVISVLDLGHGCCEASAFRISVNSTSCASSFFSGATSFPCTAGNAGLSLYATGTGAPITPTTFASAVFNKWQIRSVDLSPYIGQTVKVSILAAACKAGGHQGYAYIDMDCGSFQFQSNGQVAGTQTTMCPGPGGTVTAPAHFAIYDWQGPSSFTANTQSILLNNPGVYTVTLANGPACGATTYTYHIKDVVPVLGITSSAPVSCAGDQVTLFATGAQTQTWSTGSSVNVITFTAQQDTVFSLTGIDTAGCSASVSHTQSVVVCTDLSEADQRSAVHVYPNPSAGMFTFEIYTSFAELVITDLSGRRVIHKKINAGKNPVDLTNTAPGIYIWRIASNDGSYSRGRLEIE